MKTIKNKIFSLFVLLGLALWLAPRAIDAQGATAVKPISPDQARVDFITDFPSHILKVNKNFTVYLPKSYTENPGQRYPVMYIHDGQDTDMRGSKAPWKVCQQYDSLVAQDKIKEMILVGIWQGRRRNAELAGDLKDDYSRFVIEELKPYIDKTYRTLSDRANTYSMGFSNGATAALRLGTQYAQYVGNVAVLSDGRHINRLQVLIDLARYTRQPVDSKFWISAGTTEVGRFTTSLGLEDYSYQAEDMALRLIEAGFEPEVNLGYYELYQGRHDYPSWTAILSDAFLFLFPQKQPLLESIEIKTHYHHYVTAHESDTKRTKISLEAKYSNGLVLTVLNPKMTVDDPNIAEIHTIRTYFDGSPTPVDTNDYPLDWKVVGREELSPDEPLFYDAQKRFYVTTGVIEGEMPGKVTIIASYKGLTATLPFEVRK